MTPELLGWIGGSLVIFASAAALYVAVADSSSPLRQAFDDYAKTLQRYVSLLFLEKWTGARIASMQLGSVVLFVALAAVTSQAYLLLIALLAALLPKVLLERARQKRIAQLENQLDAWLQLVANALKATGSIGEAIAASAHLIPPPMAQEVDLILKEIKLGTPVATALRAAARRIESRTVTAGFSTIIIGQQTGGDVPNILEETAGVLRELARLEQVHRTKTAEAKAQIGFMALMPFFMIGALYAIDPEYFVPMADHFLGHILFGVATLSYLGSLFVARRVLTFEE